MTQPAPADPAEIISTRVFPVPREQLFEAFVNPASLIQWWGPHGFTNTFEEFDPRPGGHWRFTMHGPDGSDYPNVSRFNEIDRPSRLVFEHLEPMHHYRMIMEFAEEHGGTRLTWWMRFDTEEEVSKIGRFIVAANEENFDRLQTVLAHLPAEDKSDHYFSITRLLPVSRERVWKAWTDPQILTQWWGPHGFINSVCELDPQTGGGYTLTMRSLEGTDYPITGTYQEVIEPEKIVATMDCTGHPVKWHDLIKPDRAADETNPAGIMQMSVLLADHGGRTLLTVRIRFQTSILCERFMQVGIRDGWSESLDSLAALLARGE